MSFNEVNLYLCFLSLQVFVQANLAALADLVLEQMGEEKIHSKMEQERLRHDDESMSMPSTNLPKLQVGKERDNNPKENWYKPKIVAEDFQDPKSMNRFWSNGTMEELDCSYTHKPSAELTAANPPASKKEAVALSLRADSCNSSMCTTVKEVPSECFCKSSRDMSYKMLRKFTNDFAEKDLADGGTMIGCGGFGVVFLAESPHGCKAAVKLLRPRDDMLMEKQFKTELEKLTIFSHENIVSLLGYSIDGPRKCLVYDYLPNGSLEERLGCLRKTEPLPWKLRLEIVLGTASGIVYLNNNGEVHRDIKSANVLLDNNFVPKVGDFATVRTGPSGSSTTSADTMQVIGTPAYMAPEATRCDVSAKLDSFGFGVILLEVLTGLAPNDPHRDEADLWSYVQETCDESNDIDELLDKSAGTWNKDIANALFVVAQKCLLDKKKRRALVSDVLPQLEQFVQHSSRESFV